MAARFYEGASLKSTRTLSQRSKVPPPRGSGSMTDMPGFIKTRADGSSAGMKGGSGSGPKREGPIGRKGGGKSGYMDSGKFRGSSDKSYRATSTAPAGKVVSNQHTPSSRGSTEKERSPMGKPKSGFHQSSVKTKSFPAGGAGHAGKMESLRGRAKTSWER